jgi:hypothetical protein
MFGDFCDKAYRYTNSNKYPTPTAICVNTGKLGLSLEFDSYFA